MKSTTSPDRAVDSSDGSAKGARNGICNRTACNHSHAIHYNWIMQKYYCTPCARRINEYAAQAGVEPLCDEAVEELGPGLAGGVIGMIQAGQYRALESIANTLLSEVEAELERREGGE